MSSKRASTGAPNIEFLRSDNPAEQDKCKEFWKYLDEKKTLQPYQPPKCTEEAEECARSTAAAHSTTEAAKRAAPKFPCHKGAKPKQPPKKETKSTKPSSKYTQYEKMFRQGVKLASYEQTDEELYKELDEYDKRVSSICPIECSLCGKVECICSDDDEDNKA